jgi:hypothetical protein
MLTGADENREIVLPAMELIWETTSNDSLRLAALSTVVNLCRDFPPAQKHAVNSLDLLNSRLPVAMETRSRPEIQICLDIMSILLPVQIKLEKDVSEKLIVRACMETLRAPGIRFDQDDFITCMETLLPLLEEEKILKMFSNGEMREFTLSIFEACNTRLSGRMRELKAANSIVGDEATKQALELQNLEIDEGEESDESEEDEIPRLIVVLERAILFCSSAATFWTVNVENLASDEEFTWLVNWIAGSWKKDYLLDPVTGAVSPESRCAALMLGNLITSDKVAEEFTRYKDGEMVNAAIEIQQEIKEAALRDAAAGLLCNLAVAKENKRFIKERGGFDAVSALLAMVESKDSKREENMILGLAGVKLLRRLLRDSKDNCLEFLDVGTQNGALIDKFILAVEASSPSASPSASIPGSQIIPKLQTEVGRLVIDLLRTLNTTNNATTSSAVQPEQHHSTLQKLLDNPLITVLLLLLTNHPDLSIRSQSFMGLALYTKYPFAASQLWETIQSETAPTSPVLILLAAESDEKVDKILESDAESGKDNPFASKQDRQNVGVMIGYLLESPGAGIDVEKKEFMQRTMAKLAT